jgi:hypothetical protein
MRQPFREMEVNSDIVEHGQVRHRATSVEKRPQGIVETPRDDQAVETGYDSPVGPKTVVYLGEVADRAPAARSVWPSLGRGGNGVQMGWREGGQLG